MGSFLKYLSLKYPSELLIVQVDNAPSHTSPELEIPENIILLYQPPYCPEVNPIERVWEYLKTPLKWKIFLNLDELRIEIQKILSFCDNNVIGFLTGWSWILRALSLSHL